MDFNGTAVFQWIQNLFSADNAVLRQLADFFRPDGAMLQLGLDLASVVFPFAALLIVAGLPVLCVAGETLAVARHRSFYDKGSRQLAKLATGLAWLLLAAGSAMTYVRLGMPAAFALPPLPDLLCWGLLAAYTLCVTLYSALWRALRSWPLSHRILGGLSAATGFCAVYAALLIMEFDALATQDIPFSPSLPEMLLLSGTSSVWNALPYIPFLALSLAGGMGALWLIARRRRDDYGRDHYNIMVPWCARWARNTWCFTWLILLTCSAGNLYTVWQTQGQLAAQLYVETTVRLLFWLLPGLLWLPTLKSAIPLRHKLTLTLAFLLAMGFLVPLYMGVLDIAV